jgi:hypothetical protein
MKENDKTSHRAELMRDIVAMVNQNPVLKQAWQRKKEKSIQNTQLSSYFSLHFNLNTE